ncbi:hypothetical protein LTR53_018047 [Teratosphaeriaceae sp. CCFEE 6253]|nr:hypothetical protein LTR53_018047 [Teratosphaeriaceae sp. CCFEE 6253]
MNDNDTIGDVICVSTIAGVRPPPQPGESSSLPDVGLPPAEPDETAGWNVVTRGRAGTRAKKNAKRPQTGARLSRQASTNSFEAATATAKKRKAEESTAEQIVQLKELLLRLIKSHDEQMAIDKGQHEKLLVAAEQQAKDIEELRAIIGRQAVEIAKLTAAPRLIGTSRPTYSDAVRRTSSASSDCETTLVPEPDATKGPKNGGLKDDRMAITVNTTRVKKNKQDTAVMRDALNQSFATSR